MAAPNTEYTSVIEDLQQPAKNATTLGGDPDKQPALERGNRWEHESLSIGFEDLEDGLFEWGDYNAEFDDLLADTPSLPQDLRQHATQPQIQNHQASEAVYSSDLSSYPLTEKRKWTQIDDFDSCISSKKCPRTTTTTPGLSDATGVYRTAKPAVPVAKELHSISTFLPYPTQQSQFTPASRNAIGNFEGDVRSRVDNEQVRNTGFQAQRVDNMDTERNLQPMAETFSFTEYLMEDHNEEFGMADFDLAKELPDETLNPPDAQLNAPTPLNGQRTVRLASLATPVKSHESDWKLWNSDTRPRKIDEAIYTSISGIGHEFKRSKPNSSRPIQGFHKRVQQNGVFDYARTPTAPSLTGSSNSLMHSKNQDVEGTTSTQNVSQLPLGIDVGDLWPLSELFTGDTFTSLAMDISTLRILRSNLVALASHRFQNSLPERVKLDN
ncbi:hypothetical protein GLAREA_10328 [Glarea lozoyensis ATCC 20868]|uniref:Uncharacterized protein n=1 Tax=Glarea lozoyensis (strain ATCC 20868 / MF5171) TaxID=1116229 RepID=S3DC08_GLAL2|nr:uncharacterized protein GLAREA_10328 [Glarea lozoyensis ATCC 20868]EPE34634.1 hypothetical protein GLAREA_10328 [Glarea lozoyensis ATCC 20868]